MAHYRAEIVATRDPADAFAYLSRFDTAAEWDPGVESAEMLTDEPVGLGSRFLLQCRFAGRTIPLEYEIVEFEPARRVVLRAQNATICSTDTITFAPEGSGSRVVYDAVLESTRARWLVEPLLKLTFRRVGDRAAAGLARVMTTVRPS